MKTFSNHNQKKPNLSPAPSPEAATEELPPAAQVAVFERQRRKACVR
jgi:hypothetical protein